MDPFQDLFKVHQTTPPDNFRPYYTFPAHLGTDPLAYPDINPGFDYDPLTLDMETLMNAVAHRPGSTMPAPIQAKGPPPPAAHFP